MPEKPDLGADDPLLLGHPCSQVALTASTGDLWRTGDVVIVGGREQRGDRVEHVEGVPAGPWA